ncbi:MAG: LacI family DNA-binding transcriptional regulator [Enterococcus avium]
MKNIGIREVAKEANVSPTTVSRVLNNRGYLSEETKNKVFNAMNKLEYYPNELARALFKNETYTVGLIFPTITNPFHAELIQSIEFELSNKGYKVLLCNSLNNPTKEKEYLAMLRKNQVDGIIVGTHNKDIDDYNIPGLPIVAIDRNLGKNTVTVSCDNYTGGEIATQLLVSHGCRNILCIRGDSKIKLPANSRTLAYQSIIKENKLDPLILEVPFVAEIKDKKKIIGEYLETHPNIDGIFAGDDLLATLAINSLVDSHKNVPEDVKVVGFDGAEQTLIYNSGLTTVQQPIGQISSVAVHKLLNMIAGKEEKDELDLPVKLLKNHTA